MLIKLLTIRVSLGDIGDGLPLHRNQNVEAFLQEAFVDVITRMVKTCISDARLVNGEGDTGGEGEGDTGGESVGGIGEGEGVAEGTADSATV